MATTTLPYADLAQQANQFMTGQAIAPYLANLPNYANMVGKRTENISQQLSGQLPQDVINQVSQQAAERGVAGGVSGSPNANAAYLRALGLNSLQMQQQGGQNLSGAIADTPIPQLFNPMSLIVPEMLANREMAGARAGMAAGRSGPGTAQMPVNQLSGMPSFGAPGRPFDAPSGASMNGPGYPGSSWGSPVGSSYSGSGLFNGTGMTGGGGVSPFATGYVPGGGGGGMSFSGGGFDPLSYLTAYEPGGGGGSVDWSELYKDPNMPADWADQDWGGAFSQIDASNPGNAFMFE